MSPIIVRSCMIFCHGLHCTERTDEAYPSHVANIRGPPSCPLMGLRQHTSTGYSSNEDSQGMCPWTSIGCLNYYHPYQRPQLFYWHCRLQLEEQLVSTTITRSQSQECMRWIKGTKSLSDHQQQVRYTHIGPLPQQPQRVGLKDISCIEVGTALNKRLTPACVK